jgi:hypothetical protein
MSKTETPTPKTETPKTEPNQAKTIPNPFAAFDPMAYWAASQQLFQSTMTDAQARMAAVADKLSAFDPTLYWAGFRDAMHNATSKASSTADQYTAQYAALETQLIERAHSAVQTWAQLSHDAIAYAAQLSTEARKLGVEAARKVGAQA